MTTPRCSLPGPKRIALGGRTPSRKLLRACCRFGIAVTRDPTPPLQTPELGALLALPPGATALITGASGRGKSRLLARTKSATADSALCDLSALSARAAKARSVIDHIPLPLDRALRLLAATGLADPFILGRTPSELSVGERARFMLAKALARRKPPGWLLIDEFLTTLDRQTAASVARSFRHAANTFAPRARIVVATAHEDVAIHFAPDLLVRL